MSSKTPTQDSSANVVPASTTVNGNRATPGWAREPGVLPASRAVEATKEESVAKAPALKRRLDGQDEAELTDGGGNGGETTNAPPYTMAQTGGQGLADEGDRVSRPGDFERVDDRKSPSWANDPAPVGESFYSNYGLMALAGGGTLVAAAIGGGVGKTAEATVASPTTLKIVAHDGLIAGASVYIDANNDGIAEASEKVGSTDANGVLVLTAPVATGALMIEGGINKDTNLPNTMTLKLMGWSASDALAVISPNTTLVAAVFEASNQPGSVPLTLAQAETAVKLALGLSAGLSLSSFDPFATANAGTPDGMAVQKAGAQLATIASDSALSGVAFSALAVHVVKNPNAPVNLSNVGELTTIYGGAAADSLSSIASDNQQIVAASNPQAVADAQKAATKPEILGLFKDAGISMIDDRTNDSRLDVAGLNEGAVLEYSVDGGRTWVPSDQFAPADGSVTVTARLYYPDNGFVSGASAPFTFTFLKTVPLPPLTLGLEFDSGVSDSGVSGNITTNSGTVNVSGTTAGAMVEYSTDQVTWTRTQPTSVEGPNKVYVRQTTFTDFGNESSAPTSLRFTLDTQALAGTMGLTANNDDAINDTGVSATDGFTFNVRPQLAGVTEAGAVTVTVTLNGTNYQVPADQLLPDGRWTLDLPADLAEGRYIPYVTITDAAGNPSLLPTEMPAIVIDTTAPETATAELTTASDSGFSGTDGVTNVTRPTLHGKAEAFASIEVDVDGEIYTAVADNEGQFSVVVTQALEDGEYTPSITVIDRAGNVSDATDGQTFTVLATGPVVTTEAGLAEDEEFDTGRSSEDGITQNSAPLITGAVEQAGTVVIFKLGEYTYITTADDAGEWSVQVPDDLPLDDGTYALNIVYLDAAGNQVRIDGQPIVIDNEAPTDASGGLVHDAVNDTGVGDPDVYTNDGVTKNSSPLLRGTAEPGETVTVNLNGNAFEDIEVDANGNWQFIAEGLGDEEYTPVITVTDAAGNVSDDIEGETFTVDTTGPDEAEGDIMHDDVNDTGVDIEDSLTNNNTPEFAGTAEALAIVTINLNGLIFQTEADDAGDWTVTVPSALPDGIYTPTISVTDAAGNVTVSEGIPFEIDTTAPTSTSVSGGLTHDEDNDTGALPTDGITNVNAPLLSGRADSLALIRLEVGGSVYETQADEAGIWEVTLDEFDDGTYTPVITVIDAAGNESLPINGQTFTIDTQAPTSATGGLKQDTANDTGVSATDGVTRNESPVVRGTAAAGSAILVDIGGNEFTTTADANGNWEVTATDIGEGEFTPLITVTDAAGNASDQIEGQPFIVDVTGPDAAEGDLVHNDVNDTGLDIEDSITNNNRPSFTGTAEAGVVVSLALGSRVFTTTADADGNWTLTVPSGVAVADGEYTPIISVSDAAGNVTETEGNPLVIDTTAPTSTSVSGGLTHDEDNDTGALPTDGITNVNAPLLSGRADSLALIRLEVGGSVYETQADEAGVWEVTLDEFDDGTYTPVITVIDAAGNESLPINGQTFTIDTQAPTSATGGLKQDTANDTGVSATDGVTRNAQPTLAGTAEAGATVRVELGDDVVETTADADGRWSLLVPATLADGEYTPVITVIDKAGNESEALEDTLIQIDTVLEAFSGGVTHDDTSDTGASTDDSITNNNKPELSGLAEIGAAVSVLLNGIRYNTTADDDGVWLVQVQQELPDGTYIPTITVTDLAGNTATAAGETITVDTVAGLAGGDIGVHRQVQVGVAVDINPFPEGASSTDALVGDYSSSLPEGLSIDPDTQHIVGTPLAAGVTWISLEASDLAGNVATQYFQLVATSQVTQASSGSMNITNRDETLAKTYQGTDGTENMNVYASVNDVILAGGGNDLFKLFNPENLINPESLNFARLDGGAGNDRVDFSGTEIELDFADYNNPDGNGKVVERIESFFFHGSNSSLKVTAADIFHLRSDVLDVDGEHQLVRFMANPTNRGTVDLTDSGLVQVGAVNAFGFSGAASTGAISDKYTKFTGMYQDISGDQHLVELLLQYGLTAA